MRTHFPAMWMLEVASFSPDALFEIVRELTSDARFGLHVLTAERESALVYLPSEHALDQAFHDLAQGTLRSIRVDVDTGGIDWAILFAPHFTGSTRSWWSLTVEQSSGDPLRLFKSAVSKSRLHFAVLTADETIDELPVQLHPGNFPWEDPNLALGALFSDTGEVDARLGPYLIGVAE